MSSLMSMLGVDKWSPEEKRQLVDELQVSLGESATPALSESQRQELDRRNSELDTNPEIGLTWEAIKTSVLEH